MNPYEAPSTPSNGRLRERLWFPFYTLGGGVLLFGGACFVLASSERDVPFLATIAVLGLALVFTGWLQRQRARTLVVRAPHEVQVVRGGEAGRAFDVTAIQRLPVNSGLSLLYALLGLGLGNASFRAWNAGVPLSASPSAGEVAERMTSGGVGLLALALFSVAVWRRLVCASVRVPGEKRAIWVRSDDLDAVLPPLEGRVETT